MGQSRMNTPARRYLDLAQMERLRHVRLRPRGAAEGTFAGPHKSRYRGTAVEFADYREYTDGDDIRLVDWKVFARSDRYYVKLYEAERNLLTYVVLDTSGSMEFNGAVHVTDTKLAHACRLAAALGFLVVREGDEVGLSLANDTVHEHLQPGGSWRHLNLVLDSLERAAPAGTTDLGGCLETVYARIKRRGVLIVLSDFLGTDAGFWKSLDLFRRTNFDVMLFHVVHPEEQELPDVLAARFLDPESDTRPFNAEPDVVRTLYRQRFGAHLAEIEAGCRARGCDWFLARTADDPYRFLKHCFLAREHTR
jgi:uncharacterized protein (DUF58 family)